MTFENSQVKQVLQETIVIPPQLDIMVSVACNARCAFCVQEATWKPENAKQDEKFLKGVKENFDEFYHLGGRRVVITGGEPTLFMPRVLESLDIMSLYGKLDVKAIYTNGSLLLSPCPGNESLTNAEAMAERKLQDVNLSVHHHDDAINNQILKLKDKPTTKKIIQHLVGCGLRVRMNLTMQQGGIDNYQDFVDYVEAAFDSGVQDVYARELFQFAFDKPKSISNRDAIGYSRCHYVSASEIIKSALDSNQFEQIGEVRETSREKLEIELLHVRTGKKVYFANLVIGSEQADAIPYLITMPDGHLYKGWLGGQDEIVSLSQREILYV